MGKLCTRSGTRLVCTLANTHFSASTSNGGGYQPLTTQWRSNAILNAWRPGERKVERSRTEYGPPILVHKFDQGLVQWMHRFPGLLESDLIKTGGLWKWSEARTNGTQQEKCVRLLLGEEQ